jgi:3-deoxy-D-manno-octulosonate 8-phosphate phosphatase (KDO 8-P phosphatase)
MNLEKVSGIIFDVDGVLTDGRIIYTDDGHELKQFHVQDGASLKLLMEHGIDIAIITGRRSPMVARRTRELGIKHVIQGASSKSAALESLIEQGFPGSNLAAVGDDIQDLQLADHAGVSVFISVPNGHPEAIKRADMVTKRPGGEGVAVEIAQAVLMAQDKWPF